MDEQPQLRTYAVTAVGPDAPGEVASLAEALARVGANLEDASMTRLRGHFAMTLVAATLSSHAEVLAAVRGAAGLQVEVFDVTALPAVPAAGPGVRVVVHGADRPGIVAAVAGELARRGGNITDLTCRLSGGLYVMSVEADVEETAGLAETLASLGLQASVEDTAEELL